MYKDLGKLGRRLGRIARKSGIQIVKAQVRVSTTSSRKGR